VVAIPVGFYFCRVDADTVLVNYIIPLLRIREDRRTGAMVFSPRCSGQWQDQQQCGRDEVETAALIESANGDTAPSCPLSGGGRDSSGASRGAWSTADFMAWRHSASDRGIDRKSTLARARGRTHLILYGHTPRLGYRADMHGTQDCASESGRLSAKADLAPSAAANGCSD
jgi:hypothetical protein